MSQSNVAYADAEQSIGTDWERPAPQISHRAWSNQRSAAKPDLTKAFAGIVGSPTIFSNQGLFAISSLNDVLKGATFNSLGEGYLYIQKAQSNQASAAVQLAPDPVLDRLRQCYVFEDSAKLQSALLERPSLLPILLEAVTHLRDSFGASAPLHLQMPHDEDLSITIYAVVLWKDSLQTARAALQQFDDAWWVDSSKRASGRIVFDYQLV